MSEMRSDGKFIYFIQHSPDLFQLLRVRFTHWWLFRFVLVYMG